MKLTSRQMLFFLAAIAPLGKMVIMPARLAAICRNDLLWPVLAQVLVQAALVFCVLLLARRERTLYALVRDAAGSVCAKICVLVLSAFLLFAALLPVIEQKLLVRSIFYDTIPAYLVFTPFFLFSAYLCSRPLVSLGRMWDILAPLSLVGLAGILLLSVGSADYGAPSPAGAAGAQALAGGTGAACGWFFDAALLLPLIGRFSYTKGLAWKGALCYLAGGGVLLFLIATFYGIFSEIAVIQAHAIARMSGFFAGMTVLGRIDYLFIFAATFALTFYVIFPLHGTVGMLTESFGGKKQLPFLLSAAVNLVMLVVIYLLNFRTSQIVEWVTGRLFWIFPVFSVLLPLLLLLIFGRRPHEKNS